jgi:hypothetical protein
MSSVPFPGSGQDDGDEPPPPGGPGSDGAGHAGGDPSGEDPCGGVPCGEDDFDAEADLARFLEDIEAGREQIPDDVGSPAVTFSVGETADVDPAVLAAMAGPDGLGGQTFDAGKAAGAMPPGPLLAALAEQAWCRRRAGCRPGRSSWS